MCSYGLDTRADKNSKSWVWEVIPQNTSKQAKSVLLKRIHLQGAPADRMFGEWVSSSPHLSCWTNSEFRETCNLTRHLLLLVPSVKLRVSETESKSFYSFHNVFEQKTLWKEYSPVAPSIWEVNIARKCWDPWSFFPVDSWTPSAKKAPPEAPVAEQGENIVYKTENRICPIAPDPISISSFSLECYESISSLFLITNIKRIFSKVSNLGGKDCSFGSSFWYFHHSIYILSREFNCLRWIWNLRRKKLYTIVLMVYQKGIKV